VPLLKYIYYKFLSKFNKPFSVRENSVLLIEFKSFHGETLPGFTKYLLDLGYNIDVVLHKPKIPNSGYRNDHGLFSCFSTNNKVKVIYLSTHDINLFVYSSFIYNYKYIVVNTFYKEIKRDYFPGVFLSKSVCVVHNPDVIDIFFKTHKMVSLVRMISTNKISPLVVNPHYFGEFEKKIKKGNESVSAIFVTLNSSILSRRNLNLLFTACDKLYEKGIYNFSVRVIGKGISIPERFRENVHDLGFLNFQQMYIEIARSDFFLALIDQESTEYTNKASGSYQIGYGFLKPLILLRQFSNASGFDEKNSILYNNNNDLADSMENCINMTNDDYCNMVDALENAQKAMYDMSLYNLREALNEVSLERK
jgi:hypothetical protein